LGDDGDPLDVLILMDTPVVPGCVVRARLIGAIEAEQKENGDWTRNDRLIAVATHAQTYNDAKRLSDLRRHLVKEIEQFFASYNELRDRKFKTGAHAGPHQARELVDVGIKRFKKGRRSR
jgi:inorganic pyrophosphatase